MLQASGAMRSSIRFFPTPMVRAPVIISRHADREGAKMPRGRLFSLQNELAATPSSAAQSSLLLHDSEAFLNAQLNLAYQLNKKQ
jgi:hypothetical protein